jgi:hypothetical protein
MLILKRSLIFSGSGISDEVVDEKRSPRGSGVVKFVALSRMIASRMTSHSHISSLPRSSNATCKVSLEEPAPPAPPCPQSRISRG